MNKINDNVYSNFSLVHDFGYGPDIELQNIKMILTKSGLPSDDDTIIETIKIIDELNIMISANYSTELKLYEKWIQREKPIGITEPALISLAKKVFLSLITKILGDKITSLIRSKISEEETEDKKIVNQIVDKLENNKEQSKIKVKITKTYEVEKK